MKRTVSAGEFGKGAESISELLFCVQNFTWCYFIVEAQDQLP